MSDQAAATTEGHDSHGHDHHGFAHPMPIWQLLAVFFALIILTIATVYQATLDLGSMELVASLIIATIKASLVLLFFMHMIHDKPLNAIFFMSSFIFVALFLGFTLMDAHGYQDSKIFEEVDSPSTSVAEPAEDSAAEPAANGMT
ncbi:MAG: cytochrome C oxidase subunit IV family protein [Planctomycetota bacterium]